jgi:hypothetical protein
MCFGIVFKIVESQGYDADWLTGVPNNAVYTGVKRNGFTRIVSYKNWNWFH